MYITEKAITNERVTHEGAVESKEITVQTGDGRNTYMIGYIYI